MRHFILLIALFVAAQLFAQNKKYTTSNAHSHNDYEQARPFQMAYDQSFGSIEADVFLVNNNLLVAHESKNTNPAKTLRHLYLNPIKEKIIANKGHIYPDKNKKLILLIDCKTEGHATIKELINQLKDYPEIQKCKTLQIAISGNRPVKEQFYQYPRYIKFDGSLSTLYTKKELRKTALLSASFRNYSNWDGITEIDSKTLQRVHVEIRKAHQQKKPVRFWATPDTPAAWKFLMEAGVDFINTDKINELSSFLKSY